MFPIWFWLCLTIFCVTNCWSFVLEAPAHISLLFIHTKPSPYLFKQPEYPKRICVLSHTLASPHFNSNWKHPHCALVWSLVWLGWSVLWHINQFWSNVWVLPASFSVRGITSAVFLGLWLDPCFAKKGCQLLLAIKLSACCYAFSLKAQGHQEGLCHSGKKHETSAVVPVLRENIAFVVWHRRWTWEIAAVDIAGHPF